MTDTVPADPAGIGWTPWDEIVEGQVEAERVKAGQEPGDINDAYARVFDSEHGRAVMADLERYVWSADGFRPELGFEMGAAYGFYREGQRQLIAIIKSKIVAGEKA